MANCKDVAAFLTGIQNRSVTTQLSPVDETALEQLNMVRFVTADQMGELSREVASLSAARDALSQEEGQRGQLAAHIAAEDRRTHSILFHFESREKQQAELADEGKDRAALQSMDADLAGKLRQFSELVAKKSILDTLTPYGTRYVALTGAGTMALRDLGVRMYRVSDIDFATYLAQSRQVDRDLADLAARSAGYAASLGGPLASIDRSFLWAISIGLAKLGGDPNERLTAFLNAYSQVGSLSSNAENRLMAAEILSLLDRPLGTSLSSLAQLVQAVRSLGVKNEAALGVASILLLGQRADGTFATQNLAEYLRLTASYESAALLSVVYRPLPEVSQKFLTLRTMFQGWGYQPSEDLELSSAYLTVSELPIEGVSGKLSILSRALATYLQYPLVASAILASIPVLEAYETLNLLERAYELLGQRTGPMAQSELICLAVRMIHGIKAQPANELDATAARTPAGFAYAPGQRLLFLPVFVSHNFYYSTFSGIGGAHPGHVHVGGGFVG